MLRQAQHERESYQGFSPFPVRPALVEGRYVPPRCSLPIATEEAAIVLLLPALT